MPGNNKIPNRHTPVGRTFANSVFFREQLRAGWIGLRGVVSALRFCRDGRSQPASAESKGWPRTEALPREAETLQRP